MLSHSLQRMSICQIPISSWHKFREVAGFQPFMCISSCYGAFFGADPYLRKKQFSFTCKELNCPSIEVAGNVVTQPTENANLSGSHASWHNFREVAVFNPS